MKKRAGLGKGLDALLGTSTVSEDKPVASTASSGLRELAVDLISRSPYQPRNNFNEEALQELADSIRLHHTLCPD